MLISDPKTIGFALLFGILPSLAWLWFWLKEDQERPEPKGLIFLSFLLGMAATIVVLPIERIIKEITHDQTNLIIFIAAAEEVLKLLAVSLLAFKSKYLDEPVDYPIYLITTALGFAALENALFLIEPIALANTTVSLFTGSARFLGATLLHTVTSGFLGIMLGFAFHRSRTIVRICLGIGLVLAVGFHSVFNFFIMRAQGSGFLAIFGALWLLAVIAMILFERLRRSKQRPLPIA